MIGLYFIEVRVEIMKIYNGKYWASRYLKIDVKGNTDTITLQSAIEIRRWNHVVICLDNLEKFVEIYINGELLDTRYASNIVIDGVETSPLKINPDNREDMYNV